MGALSVLEAAARGEDRIEKLVLAGVAFPLAVSERLLAAAKANDHLALELIDQWSFAPTRRFGGNRNPGIWMSGNSLRLMERSRPNVLHTDLAACNGYANGLVAAASVRCSTLLILGASDLMAPPRNARALADTLPSSRIAEIPDCGHAMMVEQPDAVLDALRDFL
jgi:pimeloyl-ACP methyl ester carboxylesterase